MQFGALGDIHGDFEAVRQIMRRHPDVPFWLCVGDLADEAGGYEAVDAPLYWIKGNNENFDLIAAGVFPRNLHYLPNAQPFELHGVRVAGLGGTLAPTFYDTPAAELPYPGMPSGASSAPAAGASGRMEAPRGGARARQARGGGAPRAQKEDRRRHFVRDEVEACKALRGIDVFMTHEAPRPYVVGGRGGRGIDAGKTPVNEILAAMRPRLHLFGHHHRFTDQVRQGVRSVGLDLVSKSYLLLDSNTLDFNLLDF